MMRSSRSRNPLPSSSAHRPSGFCWRCLGFLDCRPPLLLRSGNLPTGSLGHGSAFWRGSDPICCVAKPATKVSDPPVDLGEVMLVAREGSLKEVVVGGGHRGGII